MLIHTPTGPIHVSVSRLCQTVDDSLKVNQSLLNAKYAALPRVTIDYSAVGGGVAKALAAVARQNPTQVQSLLDGIDDIARQHTASARAALDLITRADRYAAFLKSAAMHILHGLDLDYADAAAPQLLEAVRVCRSAIQSEIGDNAKAARQCADQLRRDAHAASKQILRALDQQRKMSAVCKLSIDQNRAKLLSAAALTCKSAGMDVADVLQKAATAQRHYVASKKAYGDVYLNCSKPRRAPSMVSAHPSQIQRSATDGGFFLVNL